MSVKIFKIQEYDHLAEIRQFEKVSQIVLKQDGSTFSQALLIGNYNIEGVELDALLITDNYIAVLEFKNWGGSIVATENGSWTSNGLTIEGGAGGKSPYAQIRLNRSRTASGLRRLLSKPDLNELKGVIIMGKDAEIDDHLISNQVKRWMRICDNRSLSEVLSKCAEKTIFTPSEMENMPELLGIQRFIINDVGNAETVSANLPKPAYGQESALSFFDELALLEPEQGIKSSYQELRRVFRAAVDQKTTFNTLRLNGLYAKMDYLFREYHIEKSVFKAANNTRDRLKKLPTFSDNELQKSFPIDLKAVCDFIHAVYDEPIPEDLASKLPREIPTETRSTVEAPVYRVIVSKWDDKFIYGSSEDIVEEEVKVCYDLDKEKSGGDWSYLADLLYKDCQINIVRPRRYNGIYYPELIILDPDYLVDVSTITKCFDIISNSPMHNLFKRIQTFDASPATMLGNFASQLLDEEVHNEPEENSYEHSFSTYIRNNAFTAITTLKDADVVTLKSDGEKQKRNIRRALDEGLTQSVGEYRNNQVMLEPSFFSEMLGIQGRMDFLQLDYKVLLEQKSGKADDWNGRFEPKDEHYLQLLLYRAILHYNYELENDEISSFLLYSKYPEGLMGLGVAPKRIFEAFKMRNRIVRYENMYCYGGLQLMLDRYIKNPDEICKPEKRDSSLWLGNERFPGKRIEYVKLLSPFQTASSLELSYFYRFMTFIENEHALAKVGTREKENSGFAAKWLDTLDDKHQAGNIYDKLTLTSLDSHHAGNVSQLVFSLDPSSPTDMSNFRIGDIVIAYSYDKGKEPDARKTMVFRGTIINLEPEIITVKLNAAQSDKYVFTRDKDKYWAIEHDFMESSFNSLYRGMTLFVAAPQERKDLLLFQREPNIDDSLQLKGDYPGFNDLALRVKQARDLFLIIGPPGTGKTSYGMLYTLQEQLQESDANVLIMSYTNRAVDEICSKLVEKEIDFIRLGHTHSCDPAYRNYLLDSKLSDADSLEKMRPIIRSTRVFVGTTTSLNGSNFGIFKLKHFDLAIIDEASQILEPHLVGLFAAVNGNRPAIQKFVMIGDHKQLPAVVQQSSELSAVADQALNDICLTDCRLSLFERLLKKYGKDKTVTYMLTKQGRMHHDIALFPNYSFYHNKLQEVPVQHQNEQLPPLGDTEANGIDQLLATRRIAFIAVPYPKKTESDKVNITEAEMIAATVVRAYLREKVHFDPLGTIGVIVPYRNQISTIRNCIAKYGYDELKDITIDTVERYQGSQREYIIYGFTIRKMYQLNFLTSNVFEEEGAIIDRKLNVAMTRARKHLIMFGNPQLLSENITFYKLIEFVRSRHGYFDIRPESFVDGMFTVSQNEKEPIDLSKASFSVSPAFRTAFTKHVLAPVKDGSPAWPDLVFGRDMASNLEVINYGRVNFSNQLPMFEEDGMLPDEQVLLYCYYIMRQHYCSSANIYKSMSERLKAQMKAARGNVQLIDIGCGPATCGLAFAEQFLDSAPKMRYNGIDISVAMREMGEKLIKSTLNDRLRYRLFESFNELSDTYWDAISETPSLVIFNLSYFFSNVDPSFSESLANRIRDIIRKKPTNRYLFIIQHSETDYRLNSFKVFKRVILSDKVREVRSEKSEFTYTLSSERTLPFHYDIWEGA